MISWVREEQRRGTHSPDILPFLEDSSSIREETHRLVDLLDGSKLILEGSDDVIWDEEGGQRVVGGKVGAELTVLGSNEAVHSVLSTRDHIELNCGTEEPLSHQRASHGCPSNVQDSCRHRQLDANGVKGDRGRTKERESLLGLLRVKGRVTLVVEDLERPTAGVSSRIERTRRDSHHGFSIDVHDLVPTH